MAFTSSSSVQKRFKYDVFLSFRGEDTRKTFVDHLYHALQQKGITTFKDDEKMEKGKIIGDQLITSIQDSRFYIIVFSKNYASSSWCLDELVKIMDCQKTMEHTVYPIFYDVEPTEVRNQSGAVGEAFAKHVEKEGAGRWRDALKEAADLAGWELKNTADGHEPKFIQKIVEEISVHLNYTNSTVDEKLVGTETPVKNALSSLEIGSDDVQMIGIWGMGGGGKTTLARGAFEDISLHLNYTNSRVNEKLVGMETRVKNVLSSLEIGSDDVRIIGIKGMGGGGKTTLARGVFDLISICFEGTSFVENIREVSKGSFSGLKELQKRVLQDVLNDQSIVVKSVYDGKYMMKTMMPNRKVLVVLDDVDDIYQLEALAGKPNWFKPGSRIIITTRDEQVLVAHQVNFIHDVNLLTHEEAICLFSRYAFGRDIPIQGYEELSENVVDYAAGLPLTIKVLGSFLCGKTEREWEKAIERLETIPLKETLITLEQTYNGLENDYKEIFLHVACILKGAMKEEAIRVLESCGFHAENGLRVLEQKSLTTISNDGHLLLHDHIAEMGRNIVRRLHPDEPKKHTRLWVKEEIEDILVNGLGTKATRCIKLLNTHLSPDIVMNGLTKMKKLIFLYVDNGYKTDVYTSPSSYNCANLPNTLRYLYWRSYPLSCLPETFQANDLVSLEMPHSNISQLWEGRERKVLKKLKFLDLSSSRLRTFDLELTPHLERLDLRGCNDFVTLLMIIECPKLKYLNLSSSKLNYLNLTRIPNLVTLDLSNCSDFETLFMPVQRPKLKFFNLGGSKLSKFSLGMIPPLKWLEGLEELTLSIEDIKHLPNSISMLKHLKSLELKSCLLLEQLPEDLDRLESLEKLHLSDCISLRDIPNSICNVKCLKYLHLPCCILLEKLPEELGYLECLRELNIEGTGIKYLPRSIFQLKDLCIVWSRGRLKSYGFTSLTEISRYTASSYVHTVGKIDTVFQPMYIQPNQQPVVATNKPKIRQRSRQPSWKTQSTKTRLNELPKDQLKFLE
ncbi:hypothetical protein L1987_01321 [Smallanthus sonchifolius]|uniref:Uncharacterized protein n=1 Tax=Smallanthus sonchifolius TaxID=185202 RepID=A0ACB9K4P8_9ASTR|nr:hypothetical protein L1987_01321 [Smallanthus sonchifolius]